MMRQSLIRPTGQEQVSADVFLKNDKENDHVTEEL